MENRVENSSTLPPMAIPTLDPGVGVDDFIIRVATDEDCRIQSPPTHHHRFLYGNWWWMMLSMMMRSIGVTLPFSITRFQPSPPPPPVLSQHQQQLELRSNIIMDIPETDEERDITVTGYSNFEIEDVEADRTNEPERVLARITGNLKIEEIEGDRTLPPNEPNSIDSVDENLSQTPTARNARETVDPLARPNIFSQAISLLIGYLTMLGYILTRIQENHTTFTTAFMSVSLVASVLALVTYCVLRCLHNHAKSPNSSHPNRYLSYFKILKMSCYIFCAIAYLSLIVLLLLLFLTPRPNPHHGRLRPDQDARPLPHPHHGRPHPHQDARPRPHNAHAHHNPHPHSHIHPYSHPYPRSGNHPYPHPHSHPRPTPSHSPSPAPLPTPTSNINSTNTLAFSLGINTKARD